MRTVERRYWRRALGSVDGEVEGELWARNICIRSSVWMVIEGMGQRRSSKEKGCRRKKRGIYVVGRE